MWKAIKTLGYVHDMRVNSEGEIIYLGENLSLYKIHNGGQSVIAGRGANNIVDGSNRQASISALALMPDGAVCFSQWPDSSDDPINQSCEIRILRGARVCLLPLNCSKPLCVNFMCVDPLDGSILVLEYSGSLLRVTMAGVVTEIEYRKPGQNTKCTRSVTTDGRTIYVAIGNENIIATVTCDGFDEIQIAEPATNVALYAGDLYIVSKSGISRWRKGGHTLKIVEFPGFNTRVHPIMLIRDGFLYLNRFYQHEIERFRLHNRWDRSIHHLMPGPIRTNIMALYMIEKRKDSTLHGLPGDVMYELCDAVFHIF